MGAIDVTKAIKNNQGKPGRNSIDLYLSGYHMLGGLIAGLVITKILDSTHVTDMMQQKKNYKMNLDGPSYPERW